MQSPKFQRPRRLTVAQSNILVAASEGKLEANHVQAAPLNNLIRKGYVLLRAGAGCPQFISITNKGVTRLPHAKAVQKVSELLEVTMEEHYHD